MVVLFVCSQTAGRFAVSFRLFLAESIRTEMALQTPTSAGGDALKVSLHPLNGLDSTIMHAKTFEEFANCPCTFGDVLFIPNEVWGFSDPTSTHHPGVCVHDKEHEPPLIVFKTLFCKGKGAENIKPRFRKEYVIIEPSFENGLTKNTAIKKVPDAILSLRIWPIYQDRYAGRLEECDIALLRSQVRLSTRKRSRY